MEPQLVGDREITATRIFDAPRELVFAVWTDPAHVAKWWGPNGFTITTHSMDVSVGGTWRFVMHGPDGRDYQNQITYLEIVKNEKLVYQHVDPEEAGDKNPDPIRFHVEVTFRDHAPGKTRLDTRMVFPSAKAHAFVIETHGALQGLKEHLGRLAGYVAAAR